MADINKSTEKVVYGWLLLAVFSLVFAGIFALLVALARTPVIENMLPMGRDYIYVALVGHVVLAVVIWFLAFEGFLWAYSSSVYIGGALYCPYLGYASIWLASSGVGLVIISAVFGLGAAELANYVPVLLTPVFYAGLLLFAVGIALNLINTALTVYKAKRDGKRLPLLTLGMCTAGLAVFIAFVSFGLSAYFQITTGKAFLDFERLFWGGGHILQFANTISMVTVWAYLAYIIYGQESPGPAASKALYLIYILFILPAPLIYFMHDTATQAHKESFTALMQWGLGPSTALFILSIFYTAGTNKGISLKRPGFSSLLLSMMIFIIGGAIALTIRGVNTIIPAHYHCVIGAVTISFMGLFYEVIPAVKRRLYSVRLAVVQPYVYFAGILLFAAGLYIAGAHGVARKTYAGAQNLDNVWKFIGMGIMGLGGLVSIAGGIMFVVNALPTLLGRADETASAEVLRCAARAK